MCRFTINCKDAVKRIRLHIVFHTSMWWGDMFILFSRWYLYGFKSRCRSVLLLYVQVILLLNWSGSLCRFEFLKYLFCCSCKRLETYNDAPLSSTLPLSLHASATTVCSNRDDKKTTGVEFWKKQHVCFVFIYIHFFIYSIIHHPMVAAPVVLLVIWS